MNNFFRFLTDVKYDLLVPPQGINYGEMTPKQAKESFEWFVEKIPERMEYFRNRCAKDLKISVEQLDYSRESLVLVWQWFLKTARREKTPKEQLEKMKQNAQIFGPSFINYEQFTVATHFIIRDIAMYVGQYWISNYPQLYWTYKTKPKDSVTVNQPIISGLRTSYKGKEKVISFAPLHMVGVQAANIFDKSAKKNDLLKVIMFWEQYIPND